MKRKIFKITLITILISIMYSLFSSVQAVANIKKYTYTTVDEYLNSSDRRLNGDSKPYDQPSTVYDFIDEDDLFNTVYVSANNVYWSKLDKNFGIISTVSWPLFYNINKEENVPSINIDLTCNFGGALYYNKHLYVMYSRLVSAPTAAEKLEENTMAMAKYNKKGELIKVVEYKGKELNPKDRDDGFGTSAPFYSANCSLTVNSGRIACFFGRNMYIGHQSSLLMFIDPDTLEFLSNIRSDTVDVPMYFNVYSHWVSHSFAQRIIPTSDGQFLMMEMGDANYTRGLILTKIYEKFNDSVEVKRNVLYRSMRRMIHFREGSNDSWGYNNTYSALGNIIELNDGYMYIGSSEKTLSVDWGMSINEPWNIFVQKYSKDFYDLSKSDEEVELLDTEVRETSGTKAEPNGYGKLFLTGTEKDYGMKWLTDIKDESMVLHIRAVKMENDNIAIIWEQAPYYSYTTSYGNVITKIDTSKDSDYYYMVIDKNANIITKPTIIPDIKMNTEEQYIYKDGEIYWTTTSTYGKNLTVNVLDIKNPITIEKGDVNGDGKINLYDALQVLRKAILGGTLTNEEKLAMDINDDGKVNLYDALQVLRMAILG